MNVILLYIFLTGVILGSFFNVVGLRIPQNQSIIFPPSACANCRQTLTRLQLIPILSYFIQKGKCQNCDGKISAIYPIIECLTGILFALTPLIIGWNREMIVALTLISFLMIITVTDVKYMVIPDKIQLFFSVIFLIERAFIPLELRLDSLLGAIVGFVLLFLIAVISKGGMGGGDVKLFAIIGYVLGVRGVLLAFFFACLSGAIVGGIFMFMGKVKRGQAIPFVPFISFGTLLAYFFGREIINIYWQIFWL